MAKERIQLIPEDEAQRINLAYMLESNGISNADYLAMSPQEQAELKENLFNLYSSKVDVAQSLSTVEFLLIGLCKLFVKKDNGEALTPAEQAFYEKFKAVVAEHDMPLDTASWELDYALSVMAKVEATRNEYKNAKVAITGNF